MIALGIYSFNIKKEGRLGGKSSKVLFRSMINITLQKGYLKIHGIPGKGRGKVITEEKQMMIIQENYFI